MYFWMKGVKRFGWLWLIFIILIFFKGELKFYDRVVVFSVGIYIYVF